MTVKEQTHFDDLLLTGSLLVLTFSTGIVDAASFLALRHVFTANMTANIVFTAFALAGVHGQSITRSILALLSALAGAAVAGHFDKRLVWKRRNVLAVWILCDRSDLPHACILRRLVHSRPADPGLYSERRYCSGRLRYEPPQRHCAQACNAGSHHHGPHSHCDWAGIRFLHCRRRQPPLAEKSRVDRNDV